MRLIQANAATSLVNGHTFKVAIHWNSEYREYRVRIYRLSGQFQLHAKSQWDAYEMADYFTNDLMDAINTAQFQLNWCIVNWKSDSHFRSIEWR